MLIAEKDENGETVYRRRSDLRRAQLEAEAKSLEAIKSSGDDSTRVESIGGPVPMEKFKAAGKMPQSCPELLQMAGKCL